MSPADSLLELLADRHPSDEWRFFTEVHVPVGDGWRRLDALALRERRSGRRGHVRVAFEVKVSRRDLRRELSNPEKVNAMFVHAHEAYLVVLDGILKADDELPDELGVLEFRQTTRRLVKVRAARRRALPDLPPDAFLDRIS